MGASSPAALLGATDLRGLDPGIDLWVSRYKAPPGLFSSRETDPN